MLAIRCSSKLPVHELLGKAAQYNRKHKKHPILLLENRKGITKRQLEVAGELAKNALKNRVAVANKLEFEILLWLAKRRNIKTALARSGIKSNSDFVVLITGKEKQDALKLLEAKEKAKAMEKSPSDFEVIEEMALARI